MIGSIKGKIEHKGTNYVIVDVGGVGYKIFVPAPILLQLKKNQATSFFTLTYVREDQITLYGFSSVEGLEFFELLLTVSGVGPKSALGIISLSEIDMIKSAIVSEDPSIFTKVSGIGRKTAERVIVELKEKLKGEFGSVSIAKEHSDALDALIALGYSQQQAREALKDMPKDIVNLQDKIKFALRSIQK
jgi:Holliday junction DNA helicase RuvA